VRELGGDLALLERLEEEFARTVDEAVDAVLATTLSGIAQGLRNTG
jgi:phosphoenolpyruvate carboxylase